jgi:hypothetical protein
MGLGSVFKSAFGIGSNTQKDFLSPEGQFAIAIGQPGYLYEESKDRKKDAAKKTALANEQARVQASNDAADAVNQTIVDAKRRRRNSALLTPTGTALGGAPVALGPTGSNTALGGG